jgi:hypothetical protein
VECGSDSTMADRGYANFGEFTFHEHRRCKRAVHRWDRKRKNSIFESSREFVTPLTMPLKNARFPCRSRTRYPQLLKAAFNALVADERTVDGPEDLTTKTAALIGFYAHFGQPNQASGSRPGRSSCLPFPASASSRGAAYWPERITVQTCKHVVVGLLGPEC